MPKKKKRATLSGKEPVTEDVAAPAPIDPETGQHEDHWVLSEEERVKGFVRPVRRTYKHTRCSARTMMPLAIAETYARDPKFYGATFCVYCKEYFPVDQFVWVDDGSTVGS